MPRKKIKIKEVNKTKKKKLLAKQINIYRARRDPFQLSAKAYYEIKKAK